MASSSPKNPTFFLLLLSFCFFSSSELDFETLLARQEQQLDKLQTLVEALSRSVSTLESSPASLEPVEFPPSVANPTVGVATRAVSGIAVTKYRPSWLERFQFLAAARLGAHPTCAVVLNYFDHDGIAKYFAVGDAGGMIYVFSNAGDVVVDSFVPAGAPVTALTPALSPRRNESVLYAGFGDGSVVGYKIWESARNVDELPSLSVDPPRAFAEAKRKSGGVVGLEVHQIGRSRYVVASYGDGTIMVFTEVGTYYGSVVASGRPLAFIKQRMVFLTETTAGWLDLRRMVVKESKCEGLNGSSAISYAFDVSDRMKAYGLTSKGEIIQVMLVGDAGSLKCRVRAARKSDIDGPVSTHAIKGYLLVVNHETVFVYNVSSQHYGRIGAPRPLFSAPLKEIRHLFMKSDNSEDGSKGGKPLVTGDREKLVVLGLGGGYIGIYRSNFPIFKVQNNAVLWSSPVLLFLLFLVAIWFFSVKKRLSLGLSPEEAFTASQGTAATLIGSSSSSERPFAEDSRTSEARDARGSVLRGPTRRYASPSRYGGGNVISYRPTSTDPPSGIGGSELKLRAHIMEPPGFPKRREVHFSNPEALGEHVD